MAPPLLYDFAEEVRPLVAALGDLTTVPGCATLEDMDPIDVDEACLDIPYGKTRAARAIAMLHHNTPTHISLGDPTLTDLEATINQHFDEVMTRFRHDALRMIWAANLDGPGESESEGPHPA